MAKVYKVGAGRKLTRQQAELLADVLGEKLAASLGGVGRFLPEKSSQGARAGAAFFGNMKRSWSIKRAEELERHRRIREAQAAMPEAASVAWAEAEARRREVAAGALEFFSGGGR